MKAKSKVFLDSTRFTLVQAMTRCGKRACRCSKGLLHGPYWYARYKGHSGRRTTKYIGKQLPAVLAALRDDAKHS
jgi:hypothetical protein